MSDLYRFRRGELPLLVSFPHDGTVIPPEIASQMTDAGLSSKDSDWFVRKVYRCLDDLPASVLVAGLSRYVVDLNRSATDEALYPGQLQTGVCPTESFDGEPLYQGATPDDAEIHRRIGAYWQPYHEVLANELTRLRNKYGYAILWDAHSIRGYVTRLFAGRLPGFNFGTNDQRSAAPQFGDRLLKFCRERLSHSAVLNGRFKGGYITRHYGNPDQHVHAIQLELNQQLYLDDEICVPPRMHGRKSDELNAVLRDLLELVLRTGNAVA